MEPLSEKGEKLKKKKKQGMEKGCHRRIKNSRRPPRRASQQTSRFSNRTRKSEYIVPAMHLIMCNVPREYPQIA